MIFGMILNSFIIDLSNDISFWHVGQLLHNFFELDIIKFLIWDMRIFANLKISIALTNYMHVKLHVNSHNI